MVIEVSKSFEKQKNKIEKIIKDNLIKNNLEISQTVIDNLVIHLSLCISRELNGSYISTSESQLHELQDHDLFEIANQILNDLMKEFDIEINENEIYYIILYLANINILDMDFNFLFDLDEDIIEDIIKDSIKRIKNKLHINLKSNKDFYDGMILHFFPAINRLINDQQLTDNPLVDQVKSKYSTEYQCAEIFNEVVSGHYTKEFNEHELAYIALHFGTAFTKE